MIERAISGPIPGISHNRSTAGGICGRGRRQGGDGLVDPGSDLVDQRGQLVVLGQQHLQAGRVVAGEPAGEGLFQGTPLVLDDPRDGQGCQLCGVALAIDQRRHDRPPGHAEDVGDHD
jgi:hypothetical protein